MNKVWAIAGFVLAAGAAGNAVAGCGAPGGGDTRLGSLNDINNVLLGKRINAVSPTGEDWKEDHCNGSGQGGALYKVGDGSAVDPRVRRGTWSITGTGNNRTVQYVYTGAPSQPAWTLYQNGATLYFCNGATEIAHTVSTPTAAGTPCN